MGFDEDDEELGLDDDIEEEEEEGEGEELPLEFGVDFSTGKMTGGKVTGKKAVAVWAWNALMYPRYHYELASWQYGSELSDLIGRSPDEDEASMMAESIVRDALLPNEYIEDIEDFTCTLESDKITVSFTLITPFGEEELNDVTIR